MRASRYRSVAMADTQEVIDAASVSNLARRVLDNLAAVIQALAPWVLAHRLILAPRLVGLSDSDPVRGLAARVDALEGLAPLLAAGLLLL